MLSQLPRVFHRHRPQRAPPVPERDLAQGAAWLPGAGDGHLHLCRRAHWPAAGSAPAPGKGKSSSPAGHTCLFSLSYWAYCSHFWGVPWGGRSLTCNWREVAVPLTLVHDLGVFLWPSCCRLSSLKCTRFVRFFFFLNFLNSQCRHSMLQLPVSLNVLGYLSKFNLTTESFSK